MKERLFFSATFLFVAAFASLAQDVTFERLLDASREPHNWLTYSGNYSGQRYSLLTQIGPENVRHLTLKWAYQPRYLDKHESTPLVVDGVMYTVHGDEVVAMDAATGRLFWKYQRSITPGSLYYLKVSRGLAIWQNTLFWGTIDAHLIAIDAKNGRVLWDVTVANSKVGNSLTNAPLVVKDMVITGTTTSEYGQNCFMYAFDVRTGKQLWKFNLVPEPGEPGHGSWGGDAWKHGGAPIWVTGSYDPETNLTIWGTGNPNPGWNTDPRPGDNLYADSVVALDADTGKLEWYYQFTPGDPFDWDSVQIPVLADIQWQGSPRKVMLWANRNGFFYVLDRQTGQFLSAKAFIKQNWNVGFDNGRPIRAPGSVSSPSGTLIQPGTQGGTNWYSPSFSPRTGLFYVPTWDNYSSVSTSAPAVYVEGAPGGYRGSGGGGRRAAAAAAGATGRGQTLGAASGTRGVPGAYRKEEEGYGAVRALDPLTGEKRWDFKLVDYTESGILTTGSDLLFSGSMEGNFFALDARSGALLWNTQLGAAINNGPMTYAVNGRQYVAVGSGSSLFVFGLDE